MVYLMLLLQSLVNYLDCWTGEYRDDLPLKTTIMSFINAALKYGPGQVHAYTSHFIYVAVIMCELLV